MPDTTIYGTNGNDNLSGGNGKDTIHGLGGDDIISGGNGIDNLFGDAGNDQLYGDNGADSLTGGAGDDLVDGLNGFDIAYYSGQIGEYSFYAAAGYLHVVHSGGAGDDGHDRLIRVERLVFADRVIDIGSGHNAPVAGDDHVALTEDAGTYSSGAASVKDNDFDFDGDPLTVTGGTFTGTYGTLTLNADGTYSYALFASAQALAQGQEVSDSFDYTVTDNDGSDTGTLTFRIAGVNDAPTANPDAGTTGENATILVSVLANDTDPDNGAILTVTGASAPAGHGSASVVGNQVQFDPASDFDHLAAGDSETVVVGYSIADEHGATSASTLTITVTGTNDGPLASPDTAATGENAAILVDVLANDTDVDDGAMLTVIAASAPAGQGTASVVANQVRFDPGADFDDLAVGQSEVVVVSYSIEDEHAASASSTIAITVTGTNDGPVANPDTGATGENATALVDVLANDTDVDNGATLTVTAASAPAGQGTAGIVGHQVEFDPGSDFDHLAAGDSETVVVGYSVADEHGAGSASTLAITVTGANDGPVANSDTAASESAAILVDVLANDTDVDDGATLTVTAASAPAGQGTAAVVGNQVRFDPGSDFADLAVGDSEVVVISYSIEDEHGASASSTVTVTVTNANDAPVANPDTATTGEGAAVLIDVLANDTDADAGAIVVVADASTPAGQGTVSIDENQLRFDPGTDFDYLAEGESAVVVASYTIQDEFGAQSSSTVTITVEGSDDAETGTPTEGSDRLVGTSGADTIDALGGDDAVFGRGGDDTLLGGEGADELLGEGGDDVLGGGGGEDLLLGGSGNDQQSGDAGNDTLLGEAGDDILSGGDGFDNLVGDAGADALAGGNDDDELSGGDDGDVLSGDAGSDILTGDGGDDSLSGGADGDYLDGGDGNDTLAGGDGNDYLTDVSGTNSLAGGQGDDFVFAGSSDGPQAIDGGDGNDTIRHLGRVFASTIVTGAGSDTVELVQADLGTEALVVTDFTAGAGGDRVQLSGGGGALLSLLSGWDGSVNPFGSGFLQLQQSGADTVLQWDQDGTANGAAWETLVVFENTTAGDFTEANFAPAYDPDGSAPADQTLTGTGEGETLTGTIAADTIEALGGDDTVYGGAGADIVRGGDGFDFLVGEADDDLLEGGNDGDYLSGGDGHDQLSGDSGDDVLVGESGDDILSGGDGIDSLDGGEGDNTLSGGDGDDFLAGGLGTDTLTGGAGDDYIRHWGRTFAGTIATGAGSDTIELVQADVGTAAIVVTDFTAGGGGDKVELGGREGALVSLLSGWDGSSNPFGAGFLQLGQSGADTVLQWDQDGAANGAAWETLVVFQNATAGDFTEANFGPGYDPQGAVPAGTTITGTGESETLRGTIGADTIDALAGDDTVFGGTGSDILLGGDGFDFLIGEADDDTVAGGNDDDFLWGGDGNDQLSGDAGNDVLSGENGDDQLSGGDGIDNFDGGEGNDTLDGGNDDDFLAGGQGSDVLTGGGGNDLFYFKAPDEGPDAITDFTPGSDKIYVSAGGFGGGLVPELEVSLVSGGNPTASQASGQFLFDTDDGRLLWDADGTGSGAAMLVATFANLPALTASDFAVI